MNKLDQPWYTQWFNQDYLDLYSHRDDHDAKKQIDLINKTINLRGKKIVDACCGVGRHVKLLDEKGYDACGFDLSKQLIELGLSKNPKLSLWVLDAKKLGAQKTKYDVVLSLFTSFGYFREDAENLEVLTSYYNGLNSSGVLWLDYFNSQMVKKKLAGGNDWEKRLIGEKTFLLKSKIENRRVIKEIKVKIKDSDTLKNYREEVTLYTQQQLLDLAQAAGFSLKRMFGDYAGNDFLEKESPRAIFLLEKNEKK